MPWERCLLAFLIICSKINEVCNTWRKLTISMPSLLNGSWWAGAGSLEACDLKSSIFAHGCLVLNKFWTRAIKDMTDQSVVAMLRRITTFESVGYVDIIEKKISVNNGFSFSSLPKAVICYQKIRNLGQKLKRVLGFLIFVQYLYDIWNMIWCS